MHTLKKTMAANASTMANICSSLIPETSQPIKLISVTTMIPCY